MNDVLEFIKKLYSLRKKTRISGQRESIWQTMTQKNFLNFALRDESCISFRTQCVIMTQIT